MLLSLKRFVDTLGIRWRALCRRDRRRRHRCPSRLRPRGFRCWRATVVRRAGTT